VRVWAGLERVNQAVPDPNRPIKQLNKAAAQVVAGLPPVDPRLLKLSNKITQSSAVYSIPSLTIRTVAMFRKLMNSGTIPHQDFARFVILCVDEYIRTGYIRPMKLTIPGLPMDNVYVSMFRHLHLGYLTRPYQGIYVPTEQAIQLYLTIHAEMLNTFNNPLEWRI